MHAGEVTYVTVTQFVSLYQKEIESHPHFFGDQEKDEEQQILLPMSGSLY